MRITSSPTRVLGLGLLSAGLLGLFLVQAPAKAARVEPKQSHDALRAFADELPLLEALEPIKAGPLTVVPIRAVPGDRPQGITGKADLLQVEVLDVTIAAPKVRLRNPTQQPLLITAGRVALGKGQAVVLAHDVVVPPRGASSARVLAGTFNADALSRGDPLRWHHRSASPALRRSMVADAGTRTAESRTRVRALLEAPKARVLDTAVAQILQDPRFRAENVVGFAAGLYGQLTEVQLFGSSDLHRKKAGALLGSHGLHLAALKATTSEGELLRGAYAQAAVAKAARSVLHGLSAHSGEPGPLDVIGRGTWHEGALVHLALYPSHVTHRASN